MSGAAGTGAGPGELALGPATRLLWRAADCVHLELGDRGVVVEGLPQPAIAALTAHGPRAAEISGSADGAHAALRTLTDAGYLWSRPRDADDMSLSPPSPRLAAEFRSLAGRHGERAVELMAARAHSSVVVHGRGRTPAQLAALVAASGVGRVRCVSVGSVRLVHALPGGVLPGDEGDDYAGAAQAAIVRAAPDVDTAPLPVDERPDLTILATDGPVDEEHRAALHAAGAAHLVVRVDAGYGVVGPLVLPGLTSCLRCADLHRRDRDPAWPALAAQLALPRRYGASSEAAIATIITGVASMQALAFLDGEDPASVEGTLELHAPDWRLRRRSWLTHPDCGCVGDPRARDHQIDG